MVVPKNFEKSTIKHKSLTKKLHLFLKYGILQNLGKLQTKSGKNCPCRSLSFAKIFSLLFLRLTVSLPNKSDRT